MLIWFMMLSVLQTKSLVELNSILSSLPVGLIFQCWPPQSKSGLKKNMRKAMAVLYLSFDSPLSPLLHLYRLGVGFDKKKKHHQVG